MAGRWEVTYLKIHTSDAGTSLFANGQMQVAANILIKAVDPNTNNSYTLTATELSKIELVDYYNTSEKLTGPWTYTATENDFSHTMPASMSAPSDVEDALSEPLMEDQHKRYWVSTTRAEVKNVGARIQQPNGTVVTTRSSPNDSYIAFRGISEIRYSLSNTEWKRENTADGSGWDQDNYFLTSKVHPFKKVKRYGYHDDSYVVVGMRNSVAYHRPGPHLHFMFDLGPRVTQTVGLTHYTDGRAHPFKWTKAITIRQHANALCLVRLKTSGPKDIWSLGWWYAPWVNIFDLYGNSGKFDFQVNEYNMISVSNRGTFAASADTDTDAITYEKEEDTPNSEASEIESSAPAPTTD
ncbi:hypothetical protein SBOR_4105 [Sclerotinia borealis F-4128]|uniref:Uncharacterized protein n=1 Tax=Sclerotinia borealis (strain F-4128) TaxID=1432307 RepID=W9CLW9_SCLBF|nr:hypothetical protein SBOR_4105 [Sclerotinia borealis F-4128]